jgi:Zn-dependent protease with chaperone function
MTRIPLLLAAMSGLAVLPYAAGDRIRRSADARHLILLSVTSLVGLSVGALMILAAAVGPQSLPAAAIPDAVGRCVDAVGRLWSHPVTHWPNIVVGTLVVALMIRYAFCAFQTAREARRQKLAALERGSETKAFRGASITVVSAPAPVAYTAGLLRPLIVVSTGFLSDIPAAERAAVLAHERAHVRGSHPVLLFVGRSVERAFGFIPPVQEAAALLLTGLELAADDAAVRSTGDPLVVARALVRMGSVVVGPAAALSAAGGDLSLRGRRLLRVGQERSPRAWAAGRALVVGAFTLFAALLITFAADAPRTSPLARTQELHSVCHLPHPEGSV